MWISLFFDSSSLLLVMWLGELITQTGIGNGMSIIIFSAVVPRLPFQLGNVVHAGFEAAVSR